MLRAHQQALLGRHIINQPNLLGRLRLQHHRKLKQPLRRADADDASHEPCSREVERMTQQCSTVSTAEGKTTGRRRCGFQL